MLHVNDQRRFQDKQIPRTCLQALAEAACHETFSFSRCAHEKSMLGNPFLTLYAVGQHLFISILRLRIILVQAKVVGGRYG